MYVDYTGLNKAYPKDYYPLSRIDQLVDATGKNKLLSFMDAYLGYNQIPCLKLTKKVQVLSLVGELSIIR